MSNSIGDLKNSGLQGNNWPWQYKVLLGLDKILAAIGANKTEYEAQIIKATCPGPTPASGYYLEVRVYNTSTGSFGAPTYYSPGSTTPVNLSTCTKEYANDSLVLTQIYNELLEQGVTLDAIETAVEGTLTVQATDLDIRTLTCDDTVSLCFDNAGTPTQVSDTNPLPVNATVTIPNPLPVSQSTSPWVVSGSVGVTGEVEIINAVGSPIPVNVVAPVPVIQVNLDSTDDQVGVYGYINGVSTTPAPLNVDASGAVAIQDNGGSITVDGAVTVSATDLDIRTLTCTDEVSLCNNGSTVSSSNPLPVDPGALTPSADGVGMYGSTDGGNNWTAVQVDTNGVVSTNSNIVGPLGNQDCDNSVAVSLCTAQANDLADIKTAVQPITTITPNILSATGSGTIAAAVYSITFFNSGPDDELISFDGGTTPVVLSPGVSITMDAGGINNKYPAGVFAYDVIGTGPIIITYNS